MSSSLQRMRFCLTTEKNAVETKRDGSVLSRRRGNRSPCIVKGKHINLSNTRDHNFPRDAPRFSYQCNGESFTPEPSDSKDSSTGERATHVCETRRKRRLDYTSKCTCCYVRKIRQEYSCAKQARVTARVRGIIEQLAYVGIYAEIKMSLMHLLPF